MLEAMLRAGRPAHRRLRQRRAADRRGGDGPRAVRRAGRRAVQLPAALHLVDEGGVGRGAQRRRGPPGLVRRPGPAAGRLRRRQGPHLLRRRAGRASTTSRTRSPSSWSATPTCRRVPAPSASPSARPASACSAWSTTCSPTGPSSRTGRPRAAELCTLSDLATTAPHYVANASRRPPSPGPTGSRPAAVQRGAARVPPGRAPDRRGGRIDEVTWIDDSKATNPHAALGLAAALRPGRVGRRRPGQGRALRRPGGGCAIGSAASCSSVGTLPSSWSRFRDTRPMCP